MTSAEKNAESVRLGLIAILQAQRNLWTNPELSLDQKRRIMTYPRISEEAGTRLQASRHVRTRFRIMQA